jgi:coenzyme F420-reducing hydrogenase alpha subunit
VHRAAFEVADKRACEIRAAALEAAGGDPHDPAFAAAVGGAADVLAAARKELSRAFRRATELARKAYDAATKPFDTESDVNIDSILRMGLLDPWYGGYRTLLWLSTDDEGMAVYRDTRSGTRYRSGVTPEFVLGGTCILCGNSLADPHGVRCATC